MKSHYLITKQNNNIIYYRTSTTIIYVLLCETNSRRRNVYDDFFYFFGSPCIKTYFKLECEQYSLGTSDTWRDGEVFLYTFCFVANDNNIIACTKNKTFRCDTILLWYARGVVVVYTHTSIHIIIIIII